MRWKWKMALCAAIFLAGPLSGIEKTEEKKFLQQLEVYLKQKKNKEALELFQKFQHQFPSSLLVDYWGGKALLAFNPERLNKTADELTEVRSVNYKEAIRRFDRVIYFFEKNYVYFADIKEKLLEAYFSVAMAHFFIGNRELAISYYDRYIKVNDKNPRVWFNKGAIYEELGNLVEANRAFQVYEKLGAESEDEF